MAGTLYLTPTPIGNLGDLSQRVRDVLTAADFIAAEDTRVSVKTLNHLGLKKPMVSYYRHNMETSGPAIVQRLLDGESCGGWVTDAGHPGPSVTRVSSWFSFVWWRGSQWWLCRAPVP